MAKYKLSFTAAAALIPETIMIAQKQLLYNNWEQTRQDVLTNNLLQKEKQATAIRQYAELKGRLETLTPSQLTLLCQGNRDESKAMIWLSILKTYTFIAEFTHEVLLNNYLSYEYTISETDFVRYFESKQIIYPAVEVLKESTMKKIKQILFRMLEQLGMIDSIKNRRITKLQLSHQSETAIASENLALLSLFLYEKYEINQIKQRLSL